MKKLVALLVSALLVFSLTACGGKTEPATTDIEIPAASQPAAADAAPQADPAPVPQTEPDAAEAPLGEGMGAWLNSKSGKFYSQFKNGMYMEYEMETEGTEMTIVTATKGDKVYMENKMGGQSAGVTIMDGETMYIIDHASKTVIKMSSQINNQEMVETMVEEEDVDPASFKAGKREIDGKTYDTEEWSIDDAKSVLCFDGDRLAYIIGEAQGEEMVIKVLKTDNKVDDSLFVIPADYEEMSF